jgi:hypothetical protein
MSIKPEVLRLTALRADLRERLTPEIKFEICKQKPELWAETLYAVKGTLGNHVDYTFIGYDEPTNEQIATAKRAVTWGLMDGVFIDYRCSSDHLIRAEMAGI